MSEKTNKKYTSKMVAFTMSALFIILLLIASEEQNAVDIPVQGEVNYQAQLESLQKEKEEVEIKLQSTELKKKADELLKSAEELENSIDPKASDLSQNPTLAKVMAETEKAKKEAEAKKVVHADDPTELPSDDPVARVERYLQGKKHRYSKQYLETLYKDCNYNAKCLYLLVAVSGHETVYGTAGIAVDGRGQNTNYWGWFAGGNRYFDPDQATMSKNVTVGFKPGGMYHNLIANGIIRKDLAVKYSGNDRVDSWSRNVLAKYNAILKS